MDRFETNEQTTTKIRFVVQVRWSERDDWRGDRFFTPSSTFEHAKLQAGRYVQAIERGDFNSRDGEQMPVPSMRVVQQVSEWTPIELI